MDKFLRTNSARLVVLILMVYSCGSSYASACQERITGKWQLRHEYNNEGEGTPLKEFPLSKCDKQTTLEILNNGRFIEKSYYESSSLAGECAKDTEETTGDWKKTSGNGFTFLYDKNIVVTPIESKVSIEKGKLKVTLAYNDSDSGHKITLKFIYVRIS